MNPTEKAQTLVKLLQKPPLNPQGQIDWAAVWAANPGAREKIGADTESGRKRISVMVAHLREKGLVPRAANTRVTNHPANRAALKPSREKKMTPSPERRAAYDEVLAHPLWSKLNSRQFFAQVPELAKKLGVVDEITLKRTAQAISYRERHSPKKSKRAPAEAPVAEIPPYADGMPRCPDCGCDMTYWNRLYNAKANQQLKAHLALK